jgi:hypothetical protein
MFSPLNKQPKKGKNPPMVRKFLDMVSRFLQRCRRAFRNFLYLLERMNLSIPFLQPIGLRIAFATRQPAAVPVRRRKASY